MIDCHTHTSISPDGYDSAEKTAQKAIELGMYAVAVTEHCESNRLYGPEKCDTKYNEEHFFYNYDIFLKSMNENIAIKEKYKNKLNFINGIELGQATHDFDAASKIVSDDRLDFTIASMHELKGKQDFAFLDYKKENCEELLRMYFEELLSLCKWSRFDTLGHLTYPLRYMTGEAGINIDISVYDEIIEECFKTLASNDKGLEINTSGLRQLFGKTFPDIKYIRLFKKCGGKIVTVGSDAHCTSDIAKGINDAITLAKEAGFEKIYYFEKHIPYGIKI